MDVLKTIFTLRDNKRLLQKDFADALGVSASAITNLEAGKRELKVNELPIIANLLNVEIIDLFTYPDVYIKKESSIEPLPSETEASPYKLLYELQKENAELWKEVGELRLENERLKNESVIGRNAIAG